MNQLDDLPKFGTDIHNITDKIKVPGKLPIPPKVDLPDVPPMDASLTRLEKLQQFINGVFSGVGKLVDTVYNAEQLVANVKSTLQWLVILLAFGLIVFIGFKLFA